MNGYLYFRDLERIMKKALGSGLAVFGIVFIAGVLYGWAYALLIGLIIVFLVTMAGGRK
jgi:polyferredoxin